MFTGEEDQDGYDMSRLRKPGNLEPVTNPMYEPGIRTTQPLGKGSCENIGL